MPILPIPSVNSLIIKTTNIIKTAMRRPSKTTTVNNRTTFNRPSKDNSRSVARYQQHALHYALAGLGYLPTPVLERLNISLGGPTVKEYPHADAHLRSIVAFNNKFKQPLQLATLMELRQRFATAAVSMQAPNVWLQSDNGINIEVGTDTNIGTKSKNKSKPSLQSLAVSWQDKNIANSDGGDMTIRCYQSKGSMQKKMDEQGADRQSADKTAMLFFHGGGFCIGDVNTHHEFCHAVCAQTGWAVVSVDYRLAPEYPAPTALRDCITAYEWLAEHAHTLGALSSRIVLSGDSAGGCLAILVAQQVTAPNINQWLNLELDAETITNSLQGLPSPLAQLPLYPVTDIETDYPSWGLYGQGLLLDHDDIEVFDAAYMQHSFLTGSHALISPMHGDNTHICPSYIVAAELDILRDEALAYADQLQKNGISVQSYTVLGAPHGFIHLMGVHNGLSLETNYIINEFAAFVRQLLQTEENKPEASAMKIAE